MVKRCEHRFMGMTRNKYELLLGSAPVVHHDIVCIYQFKRISNGVDINIQETLNRGPYSRHYPGAEWIAVASFIALVAVGKKNRKGFGSAGLQTPFISFPSPE